jgi:hypothetical protein
MPQPDNFLDVIVVVSGVPKPGRVNLHEPLENLVREVLNASGEHGRDPADFELRTEDGRLIDLAQRSGQAGLLDGQTLFLNPRAGAGG